MNQKSQKRESTSHLREVTPTEQIAIRLKTCIDRVGGKKAMVEQTGISLSHLFRYINAQAILPTDRLLSIARAAKVHPNWLLTGEGSPDISPITSLVSEQQHLLIDAKSLVHSLTLAEQLDLDYGYRMSPSAKAEFVFALYHAVRHESQIYGNHTKFETSKALEVYAYLSSIQGEIPRRMILNTIEIMFKAAKGDLPEKEVRTFCNYLNTAIKNVYNHQAIGQPYFDRIGYNLEPDTVEYVDNLITEYKKSFLFSDKPMHILDIGCGNGRHLLHFSKDKHIKITGIDNNATAKRICEDYEKAGKLPQGTFVEGDIYNLPFKDNSFDFIFANAILFHAPFLAESPHGVNQLMLELRRVLKPKGAVYLHSRYGSGFDPFPFFQLHNEATIQLMSKKSGFHVQWFKKFFWNDSIEYIPQARFNDWFSTLLTRTN